MTSWSLHCFPGNLTVTVKFQEVVAHGLDFIQIKLGELSDKNAGFPIHLNEACLFWLWRTALQRMSDNMQPAAAKKVEISSYHLSRLCYAAAASHVKVPSSSDRP